MFLLARIITQNNFLIKITCKKKYFGKHQKFTLGGLPCGLGTSLVAQMVKNVPSMQETQVQSLIQKIPWRREWQPTSVFLPGEFHGQRCLVGYSPWSPRVKHNWVTNTFTFSCGLMIKNLPANAGDTSLIPGPWKFHMEATKSIRCNYWIPSAIKPMTCNKKSHCNEMPEIHKWSISILN